MQLSTYPCQCGTLVGGLWQYVEVTTAGIDDAGIDLGRQQRCFDIGKRLLIGIMQEPAGFEAVLISLLLHRHIRQASHDIGNPPRVEAGAE